MVHTPRSQTSSPTKSPERTAIKPAKQPIEQTKNQSESASNFWSDKYYFFILAALVVIVAIIVFCIYKWKKNHREDINTEQSQRLRRQNDIECDDDDNDDERLNGDEQTFDIEAGHGERETLLQQEENEFVFSFKTEGDDIENYSNDLVKRLMDIQGFKEKVNENTIEVIDEQNGAVRFIISHFGDDVINHYAIRTALNLLKNEKAIEEERVMTEAEEPELM